MHLRYLAVNRMPTSIRSLVNLEFLIVNAIARELVPLSVIQKLVRLKYVSVPQAIFDKDYDGSQTNALEFLSYFLVNKLKDEEMLKCSPHLRKLKCKCVPFADKHGAFRYPDLQFLTQLKSLNMATIRGPANTEINFPRNIRKLSLSGLCLPWEKMSIIGELTTLQVLKLESDAFVGKIWETTEGEFQQLRFLNLNGLKLVQWYVDSTAHFPRLQQLVLRDCQNLQKIPSEIDDIATLQLIEVILCSEVVVKSAMDILQEQQDLGNKELRVITGDIQG